MQEMLTAFELNNKTDFLHLFFSYVHCELNFRHTCTHSSQFMLCLH